MNDKAFTDELFRRMYDLGFNKAEIEDDVLFFFKKRKGFIMSVFATCDGSVYML